MINLYIFHYHLLPGGVTSVITDGLKALLKATLANSLNPINKITLVTGRKENTDNVYASVLNSFPETSRDKIGEKISIEILPDIDYLDKNAIDTRNAGELARKLLKRYGGRDSVWWIHNYHLGKNPIFTEAILEIAEGENETIPKLLLQIHDFPESGRYENLKTLKATLQHQPYPINPNIRYLVINLRDRNILIQSGIPEKLVYLLENPIDIGRSSLPGEEEIEGWRKTLLRFYNVNSEHTKLILYPIRAIRRKNVFEAALVSQIANLRNPRDTYKLIVTLPGVSKTEQHYSSLVENAFSTGTINGFFKTGIALGDIGISFEQLVHASDMIFSSSVQEGFGFSFIQSIMWAKPLFAREIEVLKTFNELFSQYPHNFYANFLCPVAKNIRKSITEAYKIRVEAISTVLPPHSTEKLYSEVEQLTSEEVLDFSFLDVDTQISILEEALKEESLQHEILNLNRGSIQKFNTLLDKKPSPTIHREKLKKIEDRFGFSNYSSKFIEIISTFNNRETVLPDTTHGIWDSIIDNFAKIDYLRLIYE